MTFDAWLRDHSSPTEHEVRDVLSGNLCRCTGYQSIAAAVMSVASTAEVGQHDALGAAERLDRLSAATPNASTGISAQTPNASTRLSASASPARAMKEARDERPGEAPDRRRDRGFDQIGRALPRREDWRLLTGSARFTDDLEVRDALVAHFVRSPHAHARILSIDLEAAKASPGVVTIVTGADLARWTSRLRMAPPIEGLLPTEVETLPTAKVRFQGDPVCIVARDRYQAEDAAESVVIDYEALPAVAGFEAALAEDAPRVDDQLPSNLVSHQKAVHGDPAARERDAHRVVTARFSQGRQTHVPIETAAASRYGTRVAGTSPSTSAPRFHTLTAPNSPPASGSPRRR